MTLLIQSWCHGDPCDPCYKPPTTGYPPWNTLSYNGIYDLGLFYVPSSAFSLWLTNQSLYLRGGHTISFGPRGVSDGGFWWQTPFVPVGTTDTYSLISLVNVGAVGASSQSFTSSSQFNPAAGQNVTFNDASTADQAAQWQAYNYAVANPP